MKNLILSLKTLFELRKTKSLTGRRVSCARVFYLLHNDIETAGLCDSSGVLFPVFFLPEYSRFAIKNGDIIQFSAEYQYVPLERDRGNDNGSKYDDICYKLFIHEVFQHVPCLDEWKNTVIPNPIFQLSENKITYPEYTCYFSSATKQRFHLLNIRFKAIERVKHFFLNRDFAFIQTPSLVPSGGMETYLNPFQSTYIDHRLGKIKIELPTSPEFALKKILTEGVPNIFQIAHAFRNEGELSKWHEPEFLMLEWYRIGASLKDILIDTQSLVVALSEYLGSHLEIPKHWPRFRVDELFKEHLGLDLNSLQNKDDFYHAAKPLSLSLRETDTWEDIFYKLFMEKIEPFLKGQKACFVTHYPKQMAALAAVEKVASTVNSNLKVESNFVERGEAYLYGVEICNAYFELVDSKILQERFATTKSQKPFLMHDPIFENAMCFGMPPCAGNALGIDRVVALLLGEENISSLYPIPFLSQFLAGTVAKE